MANSYFQFKEFRIEQGLCGMKVTTDACLFGAIAAQYLSQKKKPANILDIGAGTGLLSLMIAQSSLSSEIQALEIEQDAFDQAHLNFQNSPWPNRLSVELTPLQNFNSVIKFDLIISNPPFFSNNQLGERLKKNLAVHNESLSVEHLASGVAKHLGRNGQLFLLYPPYEMGLFIEVAKRFDLFPNQIFEIKDKSSKKIIRQVAVFSRAKSTTQTTTLIIKQNQGNYTDDFIKLLKPYYLHL